MENSDVRSRDRHAAGTGSIHMGHRTRKYKGSVDRLGFDSGSVCELVVLGHADNTHNDRLFRKNAAGIGRDQIRSPRGPPHDPRPRFQRQEINTRNRNLTVQAHLGKYIRHMLGASPDLITEICPNGREHNQFRKNQP